MKQFLKDNWFKIVLVFFVAFLILQFNSIDASSYKGFLVKEVFDYDKLLITDGYSQYVVELGFGCSTYNIYTGNTIFIDTYSSPSFYDDVLIKTAFGTDTCTIQDSDEVNLKKYWVDSVIDSKDEIIVEDNLGSKYLVEYGIGCLSMWRHEGKYIDIDIGGSFLDGISDQIYLFDSDDDCKVWDADELSNSSTGSYTPPSNPTKTCPANSSLVGTGCVCNEGYVADGSVCITHNQACQNQYGINSHGDKNNCYCNVGYQINSSKTACVEIPCPVNSTKINNQCTCNNGYEMNGLKNACIKIVDCPSNSIEVQGQCYCNGGYQWNPTKTVCVKIETIPAPDKITSEKTSVIEEKEELKQAEQNKKNTEIKTINQEENKSYPEVKKAEKNNEPLISWSKIFSPVKKIWSWIFRR